MNPTGESVLDLATLSRLRQLEAFKAGIIRRLVDSFTSNQSRFVSEAPGLAASGEFESLRIRAHSLKGAAASLGALPLAALAQEVEHAALTEPGKAIAALPALSAEFERTRGALLAWAASGE